MFDSKKRCFLKNVTVGDMIELLSHCNPDAQFSCDGDNYMYLHIEKNDEIVSLDSSSLDDQYSEDISNNTTVVLNNDVYEIEEIHGKIQKHYTIANKYGDELMLEYNNLRVPIIFDTFEEAFKFKTDETCICCKEGITFYNNGAVKLKEKQLRK